MTDPALEAHRHDWDWMHGSWRVRHRRLKARLTGSTDWDAFDGHCICWPTLGGFGNVDDNVLELPAGAYRAMTIRSFDPAMRQWSIWWLDSRSPSEMGAPVRGGWDKDVGVFMGDDTLNGRPIKVCFRWRTGASPRWEQAFSPDDGETWEVNWTMDFTRDA